MYMCGIVCSRPEADVQHPSQADPRSGLNLTNTLVAVLAIYDRVHNGPISAFRKLAINC